LTISLGNVSSDGGGRWLRARFRTQTLTFLMILFLLIHHFVIIGSRRFKLVIYEQAREKEARE
jgi:hypothetical protein